jgi:hypothetical protein
MADDDQDDDIAFDWRLVRESARECRRPGSRHDRATRRRSPVPVPRMRTADLLAFPGERRVAFVRKQAARMALMPAESAEAYLHQQLAIQGDAMRRRGLAEARLKRVLRGMESAVRGELFRRVLLPSDGGHSA